MRNLRVPQTTHVDLAARRPFSMVTCSTSLLFVFSLHLMSRAAVKRTAGLSTIEPPTWSTLPPPFTDHEVGSFWKQPASILAGAAALAVKATVLVRSNGHPIPGFISIVTRQNRQALKQAKRWMPAEAQTK